tara:strand:+ start:223 stop:525 length:303 start_codon:yes stop_codon:yes gene_type:complete
MLQNVRVFWSQWSKSKEVKNMDRKLIETIVKKTLEQAKEFLDNEGAVIWLEHPSLEYDNWGGDELTVTIGGEELSFEEDVIFDQAIDTLEDLEIIPRVEK